MKSVALKLFTNHNLTCKYEVFIGSETTACHRGVGYGHQQVVSVCELDHDIPIQRSPEVDLQHHAYLYRVSECSPLAGEHNMLFQCMSQSY